MAIIYLRASTNEIDLSNQKEIIKELLPKKKSFFTKDTYIEEISSEFEKSRFNQEIVNGNYKNETIYVLSIDRVCRDIEVLEKILDSLKQKNIQIFCLKPNKYFTEDDIIIRKLFQQCSKLEKEYFSAVTKKSLDNLKKQGIQLGKRRKYDFNEYFKIISEAKEIKNMTYKDIGKMLNIDPATAYRIYLKGNEEGAYRSDKRPELKEMIKKDLEQGTSFADITQKYNITYQFLTKISNEINNDELILKAEALPLELKQKIASELNASIEIYDIAKKYNIDVAMVRIISKMMKGGANW
jgi:DNA invertase Pin-like site-specific DNA recombinase